MSCSIETCKDGHRFTRMRSSFFLSLFFISFVRNNEGVTEERVAMRRKAERVSWKLSCSKQIATYRVLMHRLRENFLGRWAWNK